MRTSTWLRTSAGALLLLIAQGCNDFGITTVISTDGSVDRMIRLQTRYKELPELWEHAFPLPKDSSWHTSWQVTAGKDSNIFMASKHFESFEALAAEYTEISDSNKIRIAVDVQKRFRWFYTYYQYTETYPVFNPLIVIPPREFFTADEVRRLMSEEKSDSLGARLSEWENRNAYEFVERRILVAVAQLNDPELPASLFQSHKEELWRRLTDEDNYKGLSKENEIQDRIVMTMEGILKASAIRKLRTPIREAVAEMFRLDEIKRKAEGSYTNTVVMPGVILETNAKEVSGSRVIWKFSDKQVNMFDIEMRAESRVVNTWAVVVSGAVVLGLLLLPVVLQVRRRRS